ncbi:Receptor L-domain domain-containing protein [Caenorhabditis elegans]|uniref:Receptor L-domain domain-containing protein n=1 Tax=Caenorhabditis elegans TaxID=6239 RepID=Q93313_CAEEL|nr:Receptor L-domain domain-containing protein [Caenorhabditis elegans]CAB01730.1 Receptor L-domain domain-containing protein [Caenorhabditis elegans]|eukprot:NP_510332.1 Uncharacterized protein CELE_C31E10.4 [Caenorhabditis elegans]
MRCKIGTPTSISRRHLTDSARRCIQLVVGVACCSVPSATRKIKQRHDAMTMRRLISVIFQKKKRGLNFGLYTSPAIQLISNPNLKDIFINNMAYPYTPGPDRFIIRNNAPNLFYDFIDCMNYETSVKSNIVYNGGFCYDIESGADYEDGGSNGSDNFIRTKDFFAGVALALFFIGHI